MRGNPVFRGVLISQALSSLAEFGLASAVVVWVATSLFAGSPDVAVAVALVVSAAGLPRLVLAPFAGVLADRWNPVRVVLATETARIVLLLAAVVAVTTLTGDLAHYGVILAVTFGTSAASQLFNASRAVLVQAVVADADRPTAAGLSTFSATGAAAVAAAGGASAMALLGGKTVLLLCAGVYGLSLLALAPLRRCGRPASGSVREVRRNVLAALLDGARTAARVPSLRVLMAGLAVYGVSLGINNACLSLFALDQVGLSARQYGFVAASFPVGSLVGALAASHAVARLGSVRVFTASLALLGAVYSTYALQAHVAALVGLMLTAGIAFSFLAVAQGPLMQRAAPEGYMGRVWSLTGPVLSAASLLSTLVCGRLLSSPWALSQPGRYGLAILVGSAVLLVGGAVMTLATRSLSEP